MRRIEPRLHPRRQFRGVARRLRHRENIEAEISAGHAEYPIGETYVLRRHFQKVRSELHAFADDGASGLVKRRARVAVLKATGFALYAPEGAARFSSLGTRQRARPWLVENVFRAG